MPNIIRKSPLGNSIEKGEVTSPLVGNPSDQIALGFDAVRQPNATRPTLVVATAQIVVDAGDSGTVELLVENANPPTVQRASIAADSPAGGPTHTMRATLTAVVPAGWRYEVSTLVGAAAPSFTLVHLQEYELV